MSTEKKVLLVVLAVVALLVVFLFSSEVVEKEIAPKPRAAWVAVEVGDSGIARTGSVDIEAETLRGQTIYYTEAQQLEIDGRMIPPEALRVWKRSTEPRILWFTVEGFKPFLEVESDPQLTEFRFQDNFRADWPRTWSIPGDLRPRGETDLKIGTVEGLPRFGTQRYHVRVEIFGPESEITPQLRLQSSRAEDLPTGNQGVSRVRATLPDPLIRASRVYGLSQIEPTSEATPDVQEQLSQWYEEGLVFSRLLVLRDHLIRSGSSYGDLEWVAVELGLDQPWGDGGVAAGDLLRVGNRWVILLRDQTSPGLLDVGDLCLDLDKGARVREVGEVFTGEGLVEWAELGPRVVDE